MTGSPLRMRHGVGLAVVAACLLAACAGKPPPPDWQMNAKAALDRATEAYLSGNAALEDLDFARARADLARTGQPALVARAELLRCATRVASLVFEQCTGFAALAADATAEDQAYARHLAGQAQPGDIALLPEAQRSAAGGNTSAATLAAMPDPLSILVAAGVLFQRGRLDPTVLAVAVDTASARGWRRPLLAWLGLQLKAAESAGLAAEVERLRRRMALVQGASAR